MQKIGLPIISAFVTLFLASIIVFATNLSDPTQYMFGDPNMSPEQRDAIAEELGLNQPAPIRYVKWVGNMLTGDAGMSISTRQPVFDIIASRLPATLELLVYSMLLTALLSPAMTFLNDIKIGGIFAAIPVFWLALAMTLFFGVQLGVLPIAGRCQVNITRSDCGSILSYAQYLIMPVLSISLPMLGRVWLRQRSTQRSTAVQNLTLSVMDSGLLIFLIVLVEVIFNFPGLGNLFFRSVLSQDMALMAATFMIFLALSVMIGTIAQIIWNHVGVYTPYGGDASGGYTPYSTTSPQNPDPGEPDYSVFDEPENLMQEHSEAASFEDLMNTEKQVDASSLMAEEISDSTPLPDYTPFNKTKNSPSVSLGQAFQNPAVIVAMITIALCLIMPPVLKTVLDLDPNQQSFTETYLPLGSEGHLLGTDQLGRDTAARLISAVNTSVGVAVVAALIAAIGGFVLAILAYAVPPLKPFVKNFGRTLPAGMIILMITPMFQSDFNTRTMMITATIGAILIPYAADFLLSDNRNPTKSIVPLAGVYLVFVLEALLLETAMSFLGAGISPPVASLGSMLVDVRMIARQSPAYVYIIGLPLMLISLLIIYGGRWLMQQDDN